MAKLDSAKFPVAPINPNDMKLVRGREGEEHTYQIMEERLPDDWVILRNVFFFSPTAYGLDTSHELDCLVLIPGKGMVVVEIKNWPNGGIDNGVWYYNMRAKKRAEYPPLQQAQRASNAIHSALVEGQLIDQQVIHRQMVILCTEIKGLSEIESADKYITHEEILSKKSALKDKMLALFPSYRFSSVPPFSTETVEKIRNFLAPTVHFKIPICYYLYKVYEKSAPVLGMLKHLEDCPNNILVKGCAGSGKTLMLTQEVQRLSKKNPNANILVLCFNRNLEQKFRKDFKNFKVDIMTFSGYIAGLAEKYIDVKDIDTVLFDLCDKVKKRYDYIFFDEAQDMREGWDIMVQESLVPKKGKAYYFMDSNQNIYSGTAVENYQTIVKLGENLRNCKEIAELSNELLPKDVCKPGVLNVEGGEVHLHPPMPNVMDRAQQVRKIISDIHDEHKVLNRDIVVLSPWSSDNKLCSFSKLADCVSSAPAKESKQDCEKRHSACLKEKCKTVLGDTVKAFKGLEAIHVILTDVVEPCQAFSENDLYVACTRARYSLHIIPIDEQANLYLKGKLEDNGAE